MRPNKIGAAAVLGIVLLGVSAAAQAQTKKDYLSDLEANKIRDAENPSDRIKLFLTFAEDRIKKFQYELNRSSADRRRAERLNGLLNAYTGCVDDAADLINLARDKQTNIHAGIKFMQAKGKEFLSFLEQLYAKGEELESYKDTLDDAIEATKAALEDTDKAAKEIAPPPVRRKQ